VHLTRTASLCQRKILAALRAYGKAGNPKASVWGGVGAGAPGIVGRFGVATSGMLGAGAADAVLEGAALGASSGRGVSLRLTVALANSPANQAS
jgi:hypothetical protein